MGSTILCDLIIATSMIRFVCTFHPRYSVVLIRMYSAFSRWGSVPKNPTIYQKADHNVFRYRFYDR